MDIQKQALELYERMKKADYNIDADEELLKEIKLFLEENNYQSKNQFVQSIMFCLNALLSSKKLMERLAELEENELVKEYISKCQEFNRDQLFINEIIQHIEVQKEEVNKTR